MILSSICAPALIYIGFSLIQIFIDIYNNSINEAFLKFIFMLVFTLIINILCDLGFVVIAWIIVFIPIIMMTIISTLLLQVFGLDPKNKQISSNTKNARDLSANSPGLTGTELLNQQKYAYYYDKYEKENRIDRDKLRYKLYDSIDDVYKLPFNSESIYDLSNNPKKYFITDKVLNFFGEYIFINHMNNSQLYHTIFSNSLANNNTLFNNYINTRASSINSANLLTPSLSISRNNNNNVNINTINNPNKYKSYADKYNASEIKGYDLFRRSKYESVKKTMKATNPQVTSVEIDASIEDMWKKLSAADQNVWNNSNDAKKSTDYDLKYNHKDLTSYGTDATKNVVSSLSKYANDKPCPINETPVTYKAKTGLVCYEICPPGKVRNAYGDCTSSTTYKSNS
jgi:hypothetical protein